MHIEKNSKIRTNKSLQKSVRAGLKKKISRQLFLYYQDKKRPKKKHIFERKFFIYFFLIFPKI